MTFFFFQAEDGIRDWSVTGVQTCALPISGGGDAGDDGARLDHDDDGARGVAAHAAVPDRAGIAGARHRDEIGRASCRESVDLGGRRIIKKKKIVMDEYNGGRKKGKQKRAV